MNVASLMGDLKPPSSPNYSIIFPFERNFDRNIAQEWMIQNWHHTFYYILIYLLAIFGGQAYMQSRQKFELRRALAAWNISLAAFSIFGFCRILPEFTHVLKEFGFTHSVCNEISGESVHISGFWVWLFVLSKLIELGDTIFIVLRKQQLMFLHWFHHVTTLLLTWYSYSAFVGPRRWYVIMNYFAHSLMYSYYALRAMRFKTPRWVSIFITSLQILQMIVGFSVTYFAYHTRRNGQFCQLPDDIANFILSIYFVFFFLFARFFYNSYINPPSKSKKID